MTNPNLLRLIDVATGATLNTTYIGESREQAVLYLERCRDHWVLHYENFRDLRTVIKGG